jgi:N-methylhydantoinase A
MASGGRYRLAMDVGGTFVDYALVDEGTGDLVLEKHPASPTRLAAEVFRGLERLPVGPAAIARIAHGTTVAINTILEGRGARVGLVTTEGFRDVLGLGRGGRPRIYDWLYLPPPPIVPRSRRREVRERMAPDGRVLVPLDLEGLDREIDRLLADGVEAIAVSFLHSYANPAHEEQAAAAIRRRHPGVWVSVSSHLASEWREFERTSTTVLNAYLQPVFASYLSELRARLSSAGHRAPLAIMRSNGGVMPDARALEEPIHTIASGPAGGVIGAQALARELGIPNVICADVGGTSFDVALIEDGEVLERTETTLQGRPVLGPTLDVVSVGAGGGSIGWVDERGLVKVGPRSAGAEPGPACFGRGGEEPTVTDCHVHLGRIDPARFLGGRIALDADLARKAIRSRLCEPTGLGLDEAADGVLQIAEANMTYAIRTLTVERGLDPRGFVLLSYGGGGGLFCAGLAEELEIGTVIVPTAPANFSATGILRSDHRHDRALTRVRPLDAETAPAVASDLRKVVDEAVREILGYGFPRSAVEALARVDARYRGQEHAVTVDVERGWLGDPAALLEGIRERFVQAHRRLYGHGAMDAPIEVVTCRCRAIGRVEPPAWPRWREGHPGPPRGRRRVYFRRAGGWLDTPVFERDVLAVDQRIAGPAIVEEWASTVVVPPGWRAVVDRVGNLVLSAGG